MNIYVKLIAKENTWYDFNTEVFNSYGNRFSKQQWEYNKISNSVLCRGLKNGEYDDELCCINEFNVIYNVEFKTIKDKIIDYCKLTNNELFEKVINFCKYDKSNFSEIEKILKYVANKSYHSEVHKIDELIDLLMENKLFCRSSLLLICSRK